MIIQLGSLPPSTLTYKPLKCPFLGEGPCSAIAIAMEILFVGWAVLPSQVFQLTCSWKWHPELHWTLFIWYISQQETHFRYLQLLQSCRLHVYRISHGRHGGDCFTNHHQGLAAAEKSQLLICFDHHWRWVIRQSRAMSTDTPIPLKCSLEGQSYDQHSFWDVTIFHS